MHRPKESITSSLQCSEGPRAAIGPAILFRGGQKVTARRAWQTEAHPRYGSDARGAALSRNRPRGGRCQDWDTINKGNAAGSLRLARGLPERNRWTLLLTKYAVRKER